MSYRNGYSTDKVIYSAVCEKVIFILYKFLFKFITLFLSSSMKLVKQFRQTRPYLHTITGLTFLISTVHLAAYLDLYTLVSMSFKKL